jgi:hypothetical protein
MFIVSLSNIILSLSIFTFTNHHVTHLVVLSICLFHYVPHVMISSKFLRGLAKLDLLDIPKVLWSFRIFYLECLRLIIISKVFNVTILVNFRFASVK